MKPFEPFPKRDIGVPCDSHKVEKGILKFLFHNISGDDLLNIVRSSDALLNIDENDDDLLNIVRSSDVQDLNNFQREMFQLLALLQALGLVLARPPVEG